MKRNESCKLALVFATVLLPFGGLDAAELHVSADADAAVADGSRQRPFATISAAAELARPGDTVTVHAGVYREEIDPPRGGDSDERRITYRAAPGAKVAIKGSEIVTGWTRDQGDVWKLELPNSFFGDFNPYRDRIAGDWFHDLNRKHHSGAVYIDGHWLREASSLEQVLAPVSAGYLLNISWLEPAAGGKRFQAAEYSEQRGVRRAASSEGGECVGWIEPGDWIMIDDVDFGSGSRTVSLRVASATSGGLVELRRDGPDGALLGTCSVPGTGGWQSWQSHAVEIDELAGRHDICLRFIADTVDTDKLLWFGEVDDGHTRIWAQFPGRDPNTGAVEINVRQTVFYPRQTGIDYITVRGFHLTQAATPWAPPTTEQIGLIGTHWSKGWIIEENEISYSSCTGITLGKHGDEFDRSSQESSGAYVAAVERALRNGWSRDNIGGHIVRANHIHHCEQAGIVGSMGGAFCRIEDNYIHDIHVRRQFGGYEQAGIKLHAGIDTQIIGNHIHRCHGPAGIWLDWMTQGARVSGNLIYECNRDIFLEVNHGPYLVDNNVFLSRVSIDDWSQGGAYAHNLVGGAVRFSPQTRETPYHKPHSTEMLGLNRIEGGDTRFYNNIFCTAAAKLAIYDKAERGMSAAGNIYLKGARPLKVSRNAVVLDDFDPAPLLERRPDGSWLRINLAREWPGEELRPVVASGMLGLAAVPQQGFSNPDSSPLTLDRDYFGQARNTDNPYPGPFARPAKDGGQLYRLWRK